ncbi:hypothetical protein [Desertibacillus haloalkaliphilus]|uniref:hypothetical protein n=1 Tax=Desertibacillus haloalkaliphilus TaxID=1328930 RepID=UPI001C28018F|nr:hypothetical protein [Desertibacillus haloalkaliphilus]MBU8908082.1 hypothetical protein [Desertibacillus haloalkaliphilus]
MGYALNFQVFKEQIKERNRDKSIGATKGGAYVISCLYNQMPTNNIDFNSFSYEDIEEALAIVASLATTDEYGEDECNERNAGNPMFEKDWIYGAFIRLLSNKGKIYDQEDDFI